MKYLFLFCKLVLINGASMGAILLGGQLLMQRADLDVVAVVGIVAICISLVTVIGEWHEDRALSPG